MYFDSDIADDDETISFGPIRVVVDPSSSMLLQGATLDYKDGLDQSGFSIDNPNAQNNLRVWTKLQLIKDKAFSISSLSNM